MADSVTVLTALFFCSLFFSHNSDRPAPRKPQENPPEAKCECSIDEEIISVIHLEVDTLGGRGHPLRVGCGSA